LFVVFFVYHGHSFNAIIFILSVYQANSAWYTFRLPIGRRNEY